MRLTGLFLRLFQDMLHLVARSAASGSPLSDDNLRLAKNWGRTILLKAAALSASIRSGPDGHDPRLNGKQTGHSADDREMLMH